MNTLPLRSNEITSVPAVFSVCTRSTFSYSEMMSVAVSELGCTQLAFAKPGSRIHGAYSNEINSWWRSYCQPSEASLMQFKSLSRTVYRLKLCGEIYTPSQDVANPHQRLMNVVDETVDQWRKRCDAPGRVHGGPFEQLLWHCLSHASRMHFSHRHTWLLR